MSYILFLDDERLPGRYVRDNYDNSIVVIARTFDDAVECLLINGMPHTIHFDHDLGLMGSGKSGYDFAKEFAKIVMDSQIPLPENFRYYVHSMNIIGAENIRRYIKDFIDNYKGN